MKTKGNMAKPFKTTTYKGTLGTTASKKKAPTGKKPGMKSYRGKG